MMRLTSNIPFGLCRSCTISPRCGSRTRSDTFSMMRRSLSLNVGNIESPSTTPTEKRNERTKSAAIRKRKNAKESLPAVRKKVRLNVMLAVYHLLQRTEILFLFLDTLRILALYDEHTSWTQCIGVSAR